MPNLYTPVAAPLTATLSEPVDTEPNTAASFTAVTRPIADAVKNAEVDIAAVEVDVAAVMLLPSVSVALSFLPAIATMPDFAAMWGKFHAPSREWLSISAVNDGFGRTRDPMIWPVTDTEVSGGGIGDAPMWDFDVSPDGNIIAISSADDTTGTVWRYERSAALLDDAAGTWNAVLAIGDNTFHPSVVYEPVSGLWCVAYSSKGDGVPPTDVVFVTAPEATYADAWTVRTKPATFPTDSEVMLAVDGAGAIVAAAFSPANPANLYTSKSTNGGVTWSAAVTTALGFDQAYEFRQRPHVLWTGTKWVVICSSHTGKKTRVYHSANGTAWTSVANLSAGAVAMAANIGEVLAGIGQRGTGRDSTFVSTDAGATWYWGTRVLGSSIAFITASPTQYLMSDGASVYPTAARGPGNLLLT